MEAERQVKQLQVDKLELIRSTSTEIERLRHIIRTLTSSSSDTTQLQQSLDKLQYTPLTAEEKAKVSASSALSTSSSSAVFASPASGSTASVPPVSGPDVNSFVQHPNTKSLPNTKSVGQHPNMADSREKIRALVKGLNNSSTKQIIALFDLQQAREIEELAALSSKFERAKQQTDDAVKEADKLKRKMAKSKNANDDLKKQMDDKNRRLSAVAKEASAGSDKEKSLQEALDKLRKELDALRKAKNKQFDVFVDKQFELDALRKAKNKQFDVFVDKKAEQDSLLRAKEKETAELAEELAAANAANAKMQATNRGLLDELGALRNQSDKQLEKLMEEREKNKQLSEELAEAKDELDAANARNDKLKAANSELTDELEKLKALQQLLASQEIEEPFSVGAPIDETLDEIAENEVRIDKGVDKGKGHYHREDEKEIAVKVSAHRGHRSDYHPRNLLDGKGKETYYISKDRESVIGDWIEFVMSEEALVIPTKIHIRNFGHGRHDLKVISSSIGSGDGSWHKLVDDVKDIQVYDDNEQEFVFEELLVTPQWIRENNAKHIRMEVRQNYASDDATDDAPINWNAFHFRLFGIAL